jgi:hypothetical protein
MSEKKVSFSCIFCWDDLGEDGRQYCGKTKCRNLLISPKDSFRWSFFPQIEGFPSFTIKQKNQSFYVYHEDTLLIPLDHVITSMSDACEVAITWWQKKEKEQQEQNAKQKAKL